MGGACVCVMGCALVGYEACDAVGVTALRGVHEGYLAFRGDVKVIAPQCVAWVATSLY